MKSRHVAWLTALIACAPGPTIELGAWPRDAGESEPPEGDVDAGEPEHRDAGEQDANEEREGERLVSCSSQSECVAIEDQPHCHVELGHCVECLLHSDCEPGKYCRWNRCEDN